MASYHCTVKVGSRGTGGKHADYIQRTGTYKNYRDGEELAHKEFSNMPGWAEHDPSEFFRQADLHERANGSAYREIEVAIPRELTPENRIEFIREFVKQEIGENHPCVWAIHQPKSALTETEQPHAHIMFSERKLDGIERNPEQFFKRAAAAYKHRTTKQMVQPDAAAKAKGGCPKSDKFAGSPTERREKLVALRERFATLQNAHLAKHGHADRVTHKSLEAQGIDRLPEKHLGPVGARVEENIAAILRNRDANQKLAAAEYEVSQIDLSSSIRHQERKNARASRDKTRHHEPTTDLTQMRDVFGIDNVHDLGIPQDVLQPDASRDVRPSQADADIARLHKLASARAAAVEAAQTVAAAKAQAAAERGQRRRSGTPNRVIRLDQSVQAGRTLYRWTGSGPSSGKVAVIQTGNQLAASGKCSAPKAAAMAQIAQSNGWQSVKLTGDDAFKALALPEFLARGIAVSNPELQPQVQAFQAKAQAEQQAKAQAEQQAAAEVRARVLEADRQAMKKYLADRAQRDASRQVAVDAKAQPSAAAQREQQPPQVAKPAAPARPAPDPYLGMNNTQRILAERAAERTKQREAAAELSNPNLSGAAGPLTLPPAEPPTLLDRLASSWAAMVVWIKEKGPLASIVDVDTERSMNDGQIVQIDDLHAIQKTGRTTFAIHRLDALDRVPPLGVVDTSIQYRDGRGTVISGPDRGDRPGGREDR